MIAAIQEIRSEVIKKAERRKKIVDALLMIGACALVVITVVAIMVTIGNLDPLVAKGAVILGR